LAGNAWFFSNELFDAQPFRRFVFRGGAWREFGVALEGRALREVEWRGMADCGSFKNHGLEARATTGLARGWSLPPGAPEGWHLDLPLASVALADEIAARPWSGLFIACDYGKGWRELVEASAAGTARAYYRHTQSNDLLARPGGQDLTCHVCWDWLADALARAGFAGLGADAPRVESQEAFFMRHAGGYLAGAIANAGAGAAGAARRRALAQLLHPAHLGLRFQVLHGYRGRPDAGGVET